MVHFVINSARPARVGTVDPARDEIR